jgi:O-Antigen ligase
MRGSRGVGGTAATSDRDDAATTAGDCTTSIDRFPHTRRPLPWVLAGFLAMLFFIPIDSTQVNVSLPVDSHMDRFAIMFLLLAWIWFGGDQRAFLRTPRSKLYVAAACAFLVVAVASVLLQAGRIVNLDELNLAEKRFGLLVSFLVLSWFVLTALRFEDVRGFATYLIGLGTVTAIGMIIERRTGTNVFFNWSGSILKPIATVAESPTNIHPEFDRGGRLVVVGPTRHGLAAATLLVVVMPFALVRVLDAISRRTRWLNATAFALMFAAAMATDRKTALLVPVAVVLYFAIYRPRQILRLVPIGLLAVIAIVHIASPGALGTILSLNRDVNSNSTTHRANDVPNLMPDIVTHPILGRGFGTVNGEQPAQFRVNDNQYLDEIWEVGAVGLLAYVLMILAPVALARGAIRSRDPAVASLALAASGGCVAYLVVNVLFDAMSFPQAPYMFFVVAALTTIAAAGPAGNVEPIRRRAIRIAREARLMASHA